MSLKQSDTAPTTVRSLGRPLKRLLTYLRPYQGQLGLALALVLVGTLLSVLGPVLMGIAIDDFITTKDVPGLAQISFWMLAVYAGSWLVNSLQGRLMASVAQKSMRDLRQALFEHLQTLSLSFFDRQPIGDLMSRLTNDMDAITQLLSQNLTQFISSIFTLLSIVIMMFVLNVWLALATLIVVPIMVIVVVVIGKRTQPAFRDLQEDLGDLNGLMEEHLSGQRVIIAFGQQVDALTDFDEANDTARDSGIRAQIWAGFIAPITQALTNLNMAVVAGVGSYMALTGFAGVTVGLIATFTSYARRFSQPLIQMANLYNAILAALAGAERIFDLLDEVPTILDAAEAQPLAPVAGHVRFNQVDFGYTPDSPILKNVALEAKPGQTIALVGPTGAGKTTIINLLTRFYDIEAGSITIDNQDIRRVQQDSLRQQLGIVLQDTYLFADTVLANIRYGRLDATDEECIFAAQLANADQFIRRLPEGYQTELSERGSNLSQGQRQLLAIARAILADPQVLILDEATSSVDTRTEVRIQEALLRLMSGRTSFVIAHRLSTIREADQILVIDDGQIIERGSHDELLFRKGFYHNLYVSQFKGQIGQVAEGRQVDSVSSSKQYGKSVIVG